jgi:hypothetical protein
VAKKLFCSQAVVLGQKAVLFTIGYDFFFDQLFGREFWFPIARSSSRALDRRRHP